MNLILKNYLIIRRKKSCYIQIISIDRPEVTSILSSPYIVEEGQTVSLSCAVIDANPNTNITWRWFRTDRPYNTLFMDQTIQYLTYSETCPDHTAVQPEIP